MSSQNDMLKKDILDVLSKQMSGGGDTREAYKSSNVPKTYFGLGGAKKPAKKEKDELKNQQELYGEYLDAVMYNINKYLKGAFKTEDELEEAIEENKKDYFELSDRVNTPSNNEPIAQSPKNKKKIVVLKKLVDKQKKEAKQQNKKAKAPKKNPAKQPKKSATKKQRIDPLHQVSKEDSKKSKSVKKPAPKKQAKTASPISVSKTGKITKQNPWIEHVKQYRFNNNVEGMSVAQVNKEAKKTYTPVSKAKKAPAKPPANQQPDFFDKRPNPTELVKLSKPKKAVKITALTPPKKKPKFKVVDSLEKRILDFVGDKSQLTDKELEDKLLLVVAEKQLENMKPKKKQPKKKAPPKKKELTDEQLENRIISIVAELEKEQEKKKPKRKFNVVKKLPAKIKRKFKVVDSLEKRIIDFVGEKSQLTDKELEDKILLIVAEQQLENMKPRKCPPNKELNPKTNRCKKVVKKRNVKGKSPWLKFLDKFRAENPQIKGKDVMKQASIAYKDVIVPHFVDSESEDELPAPPDKLLDEDYAKTLPAPEDNKFNPPPRPFFKAKDGLIQIPEKTQNQILADVLDSYDNFNAEFEKVANSDMVRSFKQQEFNKIMDRAFEFNEKILTTLNKSLDPLSRKRAEDAFNHTRMSFTEGYKNLKSGHDQVEFSDYEDDEFVQKIIDEELEYDPTALDNYSAVRDEDNRRQEEEREPVITEQVNLSSKDNLPIELQVDIIEEGDGEMNENDAVKLYQEVANFDENIQRELVESEDRDRKEKEKIEGFYYEEFNKLEKERKLERALKKIRERKQQYERNRIELTEFDYAEEFNEDDLDEILDEVNYNYFSDDELEWDYDDLDFIHSDEEITYDTMLNVIDEEEENDLQYSRKPSLYPNNVLADENSIQPTSLENSNMLPRVSLADIRELKKSAPRLPTIIEEDEEEKKPKRKRPINLRLYQEFLKLMRKNDPSLSREDITALWKSNKDAYIDMLMDIVDLSGGNLLNDEHYFNAFRNIGGVMLGGAFSGTGNTMYQMKHQSPKFDRSVYDKVNNPYGIGKTHAEQAPRLPTTESNKSSVEQDLDDDDYIDMEDLSDPRAWGKTFENIGTGVYEGLKDVYKVLSPLSWLP